MTFVFLLFLSFLVCGSHALCTGCANGVVALCNWTDANSNVTWRECRTGQCTLDAALQETGVCRDQVVRVAATWMVSETGGKNANHSMKNPVAIPLWTGKSHSQDLAFGGFGEQLQAMGVTAERLLVSMRVNVSVEQRNSTNNDVVCRVREIVFKDKDGGHTSEDRADDSLFFPRPPNPAQGWLVYGSRFDLWGQRAVAEELFGATINIDVELVSKRGAAVWYGNATCVISAVVLVIEHTQPPKLKAPGWTDLAGEGSFVDAKTGEGTIFTLVDESSVVAWRYSSSVPSVSWVLPQFDDSRWKKKTGLFHNSPSRPGTMISENGPHGFFRTRFTLPTNDPISCYTLLRPLAILRSGGRVYLNGLILWQRNVPLTPPHNPNNDTAINSWTRKQLLPGHIIEPVMLALPPLENVLAVEVHEHPQDDGHLMMDFALDVVTKCTVPEPPTTPSATRSTRDTATESVRTRALTTVVETTTTADSMLVEVFTANPSESGSLNSYSIAALVFAVLFCLVGVAIWYIVVYKRRSLNSVLKI